MNYSQKYTSLTTGFSLSSGGVFEGRRTQSHKTGLQPSNPFGDTQGE